MSIFDAPGHDAGADDGLDAETDRRTAGRCPGQPGLDNTPPQWLILKRGDERLALFRGWPEPGLELTFRRMAMAIGLALEGPDLAEPGRFDDCGYVFIGGNHRPGNAFAEALRDLRRASWSIDQGAVWPVIIGGYLPSTPDEQSLPMTKQNAEGQDRPVERTSERREA